MKEMKNFQNNNPRNNNLQNIPKKSNKKIWLWILIPLCVLILGLIIFFFFYSNSGSNQTEINQQGQASETSNSQFIDCGSNIQHFDNAFDSYETFEDQPNFDCFIEASKNCDMAKLSNTLALNFSGILERTQLDLELKGMKDGKCIYSDKIENHTIVYSDEIVQEMINSGYTQEEIDQRKQSSKEFAQGTIGFSLTCEFEDNEYLTSALSMKKQSYLATFENVTCSSSSSP